MLSPLASSQALTLLWNRSGGCVRQAGSLRIQHMRERERCNCHEQVLPQVRPARSPSHLRTAAAQATDMGRPGADGSLSAMSLDRMQSCP